MQTSTAAVQRRRSTFSLRKSLAAMALVTSVSEAEAGATRLRKMVQREEQREESQRQKSQPGKKQRAGEDGANGALQAGARANLIQVADRLHRRGGQHFAGGGSEHDGGDHGGGGPEAGLREQGRESSSHLLLSRAGCSASCKSSASAAGLSVSDGPAPQSPRPR